MIPTGPKPGASPESPTPGATPPDHSPPPRGAGFMNTIRWILFGGLLLLAVVSIGSYIASRSPRNAATASARKVIYQCPMHPSYTSDRPGECPICGMTLEPVEALDPHASHTAAGHEGDVPGLTSVHMTPDRVQLIGVRTTPVTERPLGAGLDLVGFVAPDEARLRSVQIRVSGWIQQLMAGRTGERVRAGEPLLSIYSPELYQSEQEYLIELGATDTSGAMHHEAGAPHAASQRLVLLGVPEDEIRRLGRERTASTRLVLRAPVSGTVLERKVVEGQYVGAETPLLTVADLSSVWVLADLYEMDFSRVHVGDRTRFTVDAMPGRVIEGRVDFVYPTVSPETRTLKLRVLVGNPDGALRPGMYGHVQIAGGGRTALAVPVEAVVHTGEHDYLFVARAGGHFEPRMVTLGVQGDDWVQVVRGVSAGDTVVASASFLIDSESRLKAAIAGLGAPPATGHVHGTAP